MRPKNPSPPLLSTGSQTGGWWKGYHALLWTLANLLQMFTGSKQPSCWPRHKRCRKARTSIHLTPSMTSEAPLKTGQDFRKITALYVVATTTLRIPGAGDCIFIFLFFFYFFIFFFKLINLLIYLWLCWVFVSVRGLSLVAASGGHSSSRCVGLSLSRPLSLRGTGSRRAGSAIVAHGPSCSAARGIFPDQGSNPCPLHWQADSLPLRHQGSPGLYF